MAATYVSWEDAVAFCEGISSQDGRRYRLPTEAEWEWCCHAGTTTKYSFGDDEKQQGGYAWWEGLFWGGNCQIEQCAHRVGQRLANPFGLYDMHGNADEWCQDWFDEGYYSQASPADPPGPSSGSLRVLRGGGWRWGVVALRSSARSSNTPDHRDDNVGFRVLLELE